MLGLRLKAQRFTAVFCSDLKRCRDTCQEILAHHPDTQVHYDPRLREKSGGVAEGSPLGTTDKQAKVFGIPIRDYRPEEGESWNDVKERAKAFLLDLFATFVQAPQPARVKVLVVSHGGWIMEFLNALRELQHREPVQANISKNTALYIFRVTERKQRPEVAILMQNDVSHLKHLR